MHMSSHEKNRILSVLKFGPPYNLMSHLVFFQFEFSFNTIACQTSLIVRI